jgi:helix-turn-helix protein
MKYRFIAQHQQEYPVTLMCQVLEVSVSGYYAWKQRPASARQIADERLSARIRQVHEATHQVYGSRRIRAELAEEDRSCGRNGWCASCVNTASRHGDDGIAPSRPIASTAIPSRPTSWIGISTHHLRIASG